MRRALMILNLVSAMVAASPCQAVEPSVAVVETIPVGNGESILINIEEGAESKYKINVKPSGSSTSTTIQVTLRAPTLTTGKPNDTTPLDISNVTIAPDRPVPVFFRNLTRNKLRVTLQQPVAPETATKEEAAKFCKPTCTIDPQRYAELCVADSTNPSRCWPKLAVLAACGSADCEAIRKGCDKPDCIVDLYKALDTCACSVTKSLDPSTFPLAGSDALKASRYVANEAGDYSLQTPIGWAASLTKQDREFAARNVGANVTFKEVPNDQVDQDYPTVLFDAALFSGKTGTSTAKDVYRLLIEQDPAAPAPNEAVTKAPTSPDFVGALAVPVTVATPATLTANQKTGQPMRVVVVPLDDIGVANWRYLNPRNPACINCRPGGLPLPASEAPAGVVFRNRTQDRTFLISITLPATATANAVDESFKCAVGQPCKITRSVAPQNTTLFDNSILALFPKSLIKFEVSLYGETVTLGNAAAYLSLSNPFDEKGKSTLTERASSTAFKTKLSLSGRVDPDLPVAPTADSVKKALEAELAAPTDPPVSVEERTKTFLGTLLCTDPLKLEDYKPDNEPPICADRPYVNGNTQAYKGSGSINLTANLSDRADGSATLSFRDGNYGSAEIDKTVVSEYNVTIYGVNGLSLKFGKADFLIPSNGIAIAESGEGFLYSWRFLGLGHVIRRESLAGVPQQTNLDKKDWFLQARSLSLWPAWREEVSAYDATIAARPELRNERDDPGMMKRVLSSFRSADLYVVRGQDKNANSTYTTGGGELFFARPASSTNQTKDGTLLFNIFSGSIAAYQSRKEVDKEDNCNFAAPFAPRSCNGSGHVWLLTVNWTPSMLIASGTNAATTPHTLSFTIGQGTGDKPGTDRDEGYIGEPAGFAPDRLFLRTFIPKMNSKGVQYVPIGLSNKRYTAITYTNSETSLFDFVASALKVKDDVNSRSTIVSLREYKLRYPENNARGAARELNVTFNIEVPKGVTFTFDVNFLDPSEAFENRITERAWSFGANVTLSL